MYNWYLFITAVIQYAYGHRLRYILYIALPLTISFSTYLAPSSCDRNCPPQSQVARKLSPLSPIAPLYPSPPQTPSLLGFPGPNVLLIRAHPNPLPSIRHMTHLAGGDLTHLAGGDMTHLTGGDLTHLTGGDLTHPHDEGARRNMVASQVHVHLHRQRVRI
jgi:hypothetical protein